MRALIHDSADSETMYDEQAQYMAMTALEECTALCKSLNTSSLSRLMQAKSQTTSVTISTKNADSGIESPRFDDAETVEQVCNHE